MFSVAETEEILSDDSYVLSPARGEGAFELHERIGAGGMGVVYRAVDRRSGSTVAVKVIHDHLQDDDYIARLRSEAHLASLLTSPYIVRVLEFGAEKGQYFLATGLIEGRTLADLFGTGALPPARAARSGAPI